jgi:hypothetical protein
MARKPPTLGTFAGNTAENMVYFVYGNRRLQKNCLDWSNEFSGAFFIEK